MRRYLVLVFVLTFLISIQGARASISNSNEIRAVFFHRICSVSTGYDWNTIAATLKSYKFNLCLLPAGINEYNKTWWNSHKNCLAEAITACHNNGMEVHILFGFLGGGDLTDLMVVNSNGNSVSWYDPCKNITREVIKNLTTEIARDLNIDGFNFDYIRYDGGDMSYSVECKDMFAQWLADQGKPPITEWPGPFAPAGSRYSDFMEWRITPVTELVRDTREWMKAYKPNLEFSASVYPLPTWYGVQPDEYRYWIGQDTSDWIAKGYLDFVVPMQYTGSLQKFEDSVNLGVNYFVGGPEGIIPLVAFLCKDNDCGDSSGYPTTDVFRDQINFSREKTDGIAIWRYGGPGQGNTGELIDIRPYLNKVNETNPNGWFDTFSLQNIRAEDITDTTATVKWETNLPTTSMVEYNATSLFIANKKLGNHMEYWDIDHILGYINQDTTNVTSHSITLSGLQKGMIYYYRVQSQNNFSKATSRVYNFSVGEITYPVSVTGVITDYDTGLPISGATVTCNLYSALTNSTGGYLIKMLTPAPASCSLTVSKSSYNSKSISFGFTENKTYERNIVIEKIRYKIYGRLKDKNNSAVQAVIIAYQGASITAINQTDSNGNYALHLLPGTYDIQFNLTNFSIPNYYIKISSIDTINSDVYDLIKQITGSTINVSIAFDISQPKTIQIYSRTEPKNVSQNGTALKKVSSISNLRNNTWFYEDSLNKKLYFIATSWLVPICGNKDCENGEDDTSSPYYCSDDCPLGLIGYWKFDESSGLTAVDNSGFGNNGTLTNGPIWTTSYVSGSCLSFDGSDDYVKINKFGDFSKGLSIEFWFNIKPKSGVQRPFFSSDFTTCFIDSTSSPFGMSCYLNYLGTWYGLWSSGWMFNSWTHFAMTYNYSTGNWTIYRNGTSVGSTSYSNPIAMNNEFHIGEGWGNYFYGTIDEFAIFNRGLTSEEVNQHYSYGISV
jgi:hypothetical protein